MYKLLAKNLVFFLFWEICLLIEKRKQEDICDLIWQILQILDQIQFYMEKPGSSSEIWLEFSIVDITLKDSSLYDGVIEI